MNLRLPWPHFEQMTVRNVELVRRAAVRTIDAEAAALEPLQGLFVRLDAGLDDVPALRTRENERSHQRFLYSSPGEPLVPHG